MSQSKAYWDVDNGADPASIDPKALAQIEPDLAVALEGYENEACTLADVDDLSAGQFTNKDLFGYMKMAGGGWPREQQVDWVNQVYIYLEDVPFMMLQESVGRAVRQVWDPKRFVSWIFEDIERRKARLAAEGAILKALAKAAGL